MLSLHFSSAGQVGAVIVRDEASGHVRLPEDNRRKANRDQERGQGLPVRFSWLWRGPFSAWPAFAL
jgi:hypothetical protein